MDQIRVYGSGWNARKREIECRRLYQINVRTNASSLSPLSQTTSSMRMCLLVGNAAGEWRGPNSFQLRDGGESKRKFLGWSYKVLSGG